MPIGIINIPPSMQRSQNDIDTSVAPLIAVSAIGFIIESVAMGVATVAPLSIRPVSGVTWFAVSTISLIGVGIDSVNIVISWFYGNDLLVVIYIEILFH